MNEPYIEDKPVHIDDRGMLHEIVRHSQTGQIKQVYITGTASGVIKGWHLHKVQTDHFHCIRGTIIVGIYNEEKNQSWRYILSEHKKQVLTIPPNLWHGFRAIWGDYAQVLNSVSEEFNGKDEYRRPWDSIDFDWDTKNG